MIRIGAEVKPGDSYGKITQRRIRSYSEEKLLAIWVIAGDV
jgi:hypothetical protein